MRSKIFIVLLSIIVAVSKVFADTTSVAIDSSEKPFSPPNQGPLGIDTTTGLALYGVAILFAVLVLALWRSNIMKQRQKNG